MPAPHPRMHGLTHVPGGPDPVPGLIRFPTGDTMGDKILAALPAGFWKLNEDSGSVAHDSSGNGQDLSTTPPEADPLWGAPAGPPGEQAADFGNGAAGGTGARVTRAWANISGSFTAGIWVNRNDRTYTAMIGQGRPIGGTPQRGWQLSVTAGNTLGAANKDRPSAWMGGLTGSPLLALNPLMPGTWAFVALVYDAAATTCKLYVDGLLQASGGPFTFNPTIGVQPLWVGHAGGTAADSIGEFVGSYAFLVNRAMSGTELLGIVEAPATAEDAAADAAGDVLTLDADGNPVWAPPGVEVTHGDGEPDDTPAAASAGSGAASSSGWHLNAHVETAVLYDSSPARFDVPSRTWTRVPFNTVRLQRTWETSVGGDAVSAWLADDRGLTSAARNGLLQITADMDTPQDVSGWYSIEYPVLDFTGLPDYPSESGVDAYVRAARVVDASTGTVLRETPGSSDRQFFEWLFREFAADGLVGIVQHTADSPYPAYASWGARPLVKPAPYPQIDPASSRTYYMRDAFYGGFSHEYPLGAVDATLAAGASLCLQAWQDTPWQLRFSTDHFPNYTPLPYPELWKRRPYLAVSYRYDPETIDHTSGVLL